MLEKGRKNGQRSLKVIDDLDVCKTSNHSGPSSVCLHCTIDGDLNRVQITYIFFQLFFLNELFNTDYREWSIPYSEILLYLHHRNYKLFFHPAKVDNSKDEKISDYKTASVSQSKNLLD